MSSTVWPGLWGLVVIVGWTGWGSALLRALRLRKDADWGLRACLGIALSVVIGGVLNLASLISPALLAAWVLLGVGVMVAEAIASRAAAWTWLVHTRVLWRRYPLVSLLILALLAALSFIYLSSVSNAWLNAHDDYHAYLAFPQKMLQTGSLGVDPFSGRRLTTSLGGGFVLDATVAVVGRPQNANLIEPGMASIVLFGVLYGWLRHRAPAWLMVGVLYAGVLLPIPKVNVTPLVLPIALFLTLGRLLATDGPAKDRPRAGAVLLALVAATLCVCKSSLLPMVGIALLVAAVAGIRLAAQRRREVGTVLLTAGLTLLFILPWMIGQFQSSGTMLYPLLGKGYAFIHEPPPGAGGDVRGDAKVFIHNFVTQMYFLPVVVLMLVYIVLYRRGLFAMRGRLPGLSLLLGALIGGGGLAVATGGTYIERYHFPLFAAATLFALGDLSDATAWDAWRERRRRRAAPVRWAVVMFVVGLMLQAAWLDYRGRVWHMADHVRFALSGKQLIDDETHDRHVAMQAAATPGTRMLVRLEYPFLLDFARNEIWLTDGGGGGSLGPAPGLPVTHDPEALAMYLVDQGVRYAAYAHATEAGLPRDTWGERLDPTKTTSLDYRDALVMFTLQDNLAAMKRHRRVVYDDGHLMLIDLTAPPAGTPASRGD